MLAPVLTATIALLLAATPKAPAGDLAAAREVFEKNLDAIRHKDRDAYVSCYLHEPALTRTGFAGPETGFDAFAATAGSAWPSRFEGLDLRLVALRPGLVYGTYRYRVSYGDEEHSGISERFFLKTDAGWRIAVTSAFEAPPGTPPPPRALVGGTLIDGSGGPPVADAVVVLRDGRIACAGSRQLCPPPEGVALLNLAGHFVLPGLVDAHVHFSQSGFADARPDALDLSNAFPYAAVAGELRAHPERFYRANLCSGVTAVFDVGGYPWTLDLEKAAEIDSRAPRVRAAGPLLSTRDFWLNLPGERQFLYLADEATARADVAYLAARGARAVKVWYIVNPDTDAEALAGRVAEAGAAACQHDLPFVVHATGLAEAKAALRAGAHLLVHSVSDQPVDEEFLALARARGAIYCPTLTVLGGYRRLLAAAASGTAPVIDDPNHCIDRGTRDRIATLARLGRGKVTAAAAAERAAASTVRDWIAAGNLERVRDAGIAIAMGTDAGNPLTLHGPSVHGEMEAMQAAGLTPMEVIVAATRGGARALGREGEIGTITAGKLADLVVVARDPTADVANLRQIRWVVRGGTVRSIEELRATTEEPAAGR